MTLTTAKPNLECSTGVHTEHLCYMVSQGFHISDEQEYKALVENDLYIPKDRAFPLPGVVGTCGHSATGKMINLYQSFAQGLPVAVLGYHLSYLALQRLPLGI